MKSYSVSADDSIEFKGRHFGVTFLKASKENTKIESCLPSYFPGVLGKNIKNCPLSKLLLFASLHPSLSVDPMMTARCTINMPILAHRH